MEEMTATGQEMSGDPPLTGDTTIRDAFRRLAGLVEQEISKIETERSNAAEHNKYLIDLSEPTRDAIRAIKQDLHDIEENVSMMAEALERL